MDDTEDFTRQYAAQIRAARAHLGWTRRQLARASGLPYRTIVRIEVEDGRFQKTTLTAVLVALGVAGVIVARGEQRAERCADRRNKLRRVALDGMGWERG